MVLQRIRRVALGEVRGSLWRSLGVFLRGASICLAVACSVANAEPASKAPGSSQPYAAIDAAMAVALTSPGVVGAAVGVGRWGQPVWTKGYGWSDIEDQVPVGPDTVFRIGSVTKQFTATLVLMLAEQGKLSLSDPVSKYYPDFPRGSEITIRLLLSHISGLHNYTSIAYMTHEARIPMSTAEMIALIARQPSVYDFEPGTKWAYSNSGYIVLGAIIERVTGKPFGQALQDMLLTPLALTHTALDDDNSIVPHRARGYDLKDGKLEAADYLSASAAASAGAMRSTAEDLVHWHAALLGGKVLQPDSLKLMTTPARLNDGSIAVARPADPKTGKSDQYYGFGLYLYKQAGRTVIAHGGSINGFTCEIDSYPDQRETLVVLTNTLQGAHEITPLVVNAYLANTPRASGR